jgi:transcriptional regulator with XRE-family HTH domain
MVELTRRFGQYLAAHRKRRGLKQAELAERAALSVDMVAKLETGVAAPSFASIERLSEALKIDPAELFTFELGGKPYDRRALTDIAADLSRLSDAELRWIGGVIKAALEPRS